MPRHSVDGMRIAYAEIGEIQRQLITPSTASTADLWVLAYDPTQDGYAVRNTDSVLSSGYTHGPGTVVDVVVWCCLRHHHQTRQLGEETITLPCEFLPLHVEPTDFFDGTPTKLYPTTPASPRPALQ